MEAEYARRGYVLERQERSATNEPLGIVRTPTTHHFLSIPLLARARYPGELFVIPYAVAGPRLDVILRRKPGHLEFSGGVRVEDSLGENLEALSLSGSIGLGAAVDAGSGREVRVELRYSFGLTDLLPEGEALDVRHRSLDLSVGIAL